MADLHCAYDAYLILLANIDEQTWAIADSAPVFVINVDFFEAGNVFAQKYRGKLDMVFLAQRAERGEEVINIGNHDFDMLAMNDCM
jgi:hypothetical protein